MDMSGCIWVGEKILKELQVTDKINEWIFFPLHIQSFMNDSNSDNNSTTGFKDSQMDMRGWVWIGKSFLSHDKWEIKWFSEFTNDSLKK